MRILATGISSFIGQKLLLEIGNEVEILSISRKEIESLKKNIKFLSFNDANIENKIRNFKPDIFLNIASDSRYEIKRVEDYISMSNFNIAISSFLIDTAISAGVKLIINLSSNWGYLNDSRSPKFFNYYGFTKYALDKYISHACEDIECSSISLVLYDNFDKFDTRKKVFNLIYESIKKQLNSNFSPGMQIKNFTRMDDIVKALKFCIFNKWDFQKQIYFQVTGFEISLVEMSNKIANFLNKSNKCIKFGALPYRNNELMKPKYFFKELPFLGNRKNDADELIKKELFR